jgi:hypothetical protein
VVERTEVVLRHPGEMRLRQSSWECGGRGVDRVVTERIATVATRRKAGARGKNGMKGERGKQASGQTRTRTHARQTHDE